MSTQENERRKGEDRRHDPEAWSPRHRAQVKLIFGMAVGSFFFIAGTIVIVWAVTNETINNLTAGLGVGMWAMGGLAAFPHIAMPIISAVLKKFGIGEVKALAEAQIMEAIEDASSEDKSDS